jgi:hypothetical protein
VILSAVFAALAIGATTIKDVSFRLSQLSMTSTAGAFVSNAASRAHTRAAFARNAISGTVSAVTGCFAPVQTVAPRFSHRDQAFSIAHDLADCAHATPLSLRKKVSDPLFGGAVATGRRCAMGGIPRKASAGVSARYCAHASSHDVALRVHADDRGPSRGC